MSIIIADIQRRSAHIHWPQGIVPEQADLFAHNDIVIAAPAPRIWEHLIHATAWPDWYSNARNVTVNAPSGLLAAGVTFDWITFGAAKPARRSYSRSADRQHSTGGAATCGGPAPLAWPRQRRNPGHKRAVDPHPPKRSKILASPYGG